MGIFGRFIKERRAQIRLSLCDFCDKIGYDPSNWSKVERGLYNPPLDDTLLARIAAALELENVAVEELKEKALLERGKIPDDIADDEELLELLPIVMRTVRETRPSKEELEEVIRLLRKDIKKRQVKIEPQDTVSNG